MSDFLAAIPWWAYCLILTCGSATYSIMLRFVGSDIHPSLFCVIFNTISSTLLAVIILLYILAGETLELTFLSFAIAIIAGIILIGVDRGIIAMYRAGAPVSLGAPLIRIALSFLTVLVGLLFFHENMDFVKAT